MNGVRVVPFDLFGTLRVQKVTTESGEPLNFIQEDKKDDPDFFVILPKALAQGEKFTIVTSYSGKDAIVNERNGNYYPVARELVPQQRQHVTWGVFRLRPDIPHSERNEDGSDGQPD